MTLEILRHKVGLWAERHKFLGRIVQKINVIAFHWPERQIDKKFGELNPSVKFYVIRSSGPFSGLLAMYLGALSRIYSCLQSGFTPIVDYENNREQYKTQYNIDSPVNGTRNAWEYYFEQPCNYTLNEVYQSQNVRLSGWTLFTPPPPYSKNY